MLDQRLTLEPFVGQRLFVEGVLIDINNPHKKNGYTYGLVFASVTLPNERMELDHVVIPVDKRFMAQHQPKLFTKYRFTALVDSYTKIKKIYGISAHVRAYQLNHINSKRFAQADLSVPTELSIYIQNKLRRFASSNLQLNVDELGRILSTKPEGERERYLNQLTMTLQKTSVTRADLLNELYKQHS